MYFFWNWSRHPEGELLRKEGKSFQCFKNYTCSQYALTKIMIEKRVIQYKILKSCENFFLNDYYFLLHCKFLYTYFFLHCNFFYNYFFLHCKFLYSYFSLQLQIYAVFFLVRSKNVQQSFLISRRFCFVFHFLVKKGRISCKIAKVKFMLFELF